MISFCSVFLISTTWLVDFKFNFKVESKIVVTVYLIQNCINLIYIMALIANVFLAIKS